jgi:hypothetical protein
LKNPDCRLFKKVQIRRRVIVIVSVKRDPLRARTANTPLSDRGGLSQLI